MNIKASMKSVVAGAATLLVVHPAQQDYLRPLSTQSDIENLRSDIRRIGGDFHSAIREADEKTTRIAG